MAAPPSFNNTVILVTGSPVGTTELNAEITTQNTAGYWITSIEWKDANNALTLFVKSNYTFAPTAAQKVNLVTATQAAIDSDKATEIANGWWPTGIFITPGGALLILYTELFPTT